MLRNNLPLSLCMLLLVGPAVLASERVMPVGVARLDITPDHPVRLAGYAARKTESEGVDQRLWAKALAFGGGKDAAVLITVDNCMVPETLVAEVAGRLRKERGIPRERVVVSSSHTHTAPCLEGVLPTMFGEPLPPEHAENIARYTRRLTDALTAVALAALDDRRPAALSWNRGKAGFAANRRAMKDGNYAGFGVNPDGPVDHDLPVLRVTAPDGQLRAVLLNYACHCTSLTASNRICGDWAGYAQEYIEQETPGTVCLVSAGCGADSNPNPRGALPLAQQHGREVATAVVRLLKAETESISGPLSCRIQRAALPLATLPTREEWQRRVERGGQVGYHAGLYLARLDKGEQLPREVPYVVQSWAFGDDLLMVFLAGEVVVDYSLRLKKELDGKRLWVTAYANDVPCYIPSRRILAEGGYEAEESMLYFNWPASLAPETEEIVIAAVHRIVPAAFRGSLASHPAER